MLWLGVTASFWPAMTEEMSDVLCFPSFDIIISHVAMIYSLHVSWICVYHHVSTVTYLLLF